MRLGGGGGGGQAELGVHFVSTVCCLLSTVPFSSIDIIFSFRVQSSPKLNFVILPHKRDSVKRFSILKWTGDAIF